LKDFFFIGRINKVENARNWIRGHTRGPKLKKLKKEK
jgi:hypothetical protein